MTTTFIGQPVSRVDGRQKVTGTAPYAAEFDVPNVAHGAIERSAIPSGRITTIDCEAPAALNCCSRRPRKNLNQRPHRDRAGRASASGPRSASRLQGPGPAAARNSQRKQKSTTTSPPFRTGQKLRDACAMK